MRSDFSLNNNIVVLTNNTVVLYCTVLYCTVLVFVQESCTAVQYAYKALATMVQSARLLLS